MMTAKEIVALIEGLSHSTGLYGRLLESIMRMPEDDRDDMFAYWESIGFESELEFIRYYEEGVLPDHYKRPEMSDGEIRDVVAGQLSAMIENNIVHGYGVESFRGWVENGDTFDELGLSESEIERAMALVDKLEEAVDTINEVLGEHYDD